MSNLTIDQEGGDRCIYMDSWDKDLNHSHVLNFGQTMMVFTAMECYKRQTWLDGGAVVAFLNPMTNFPSASIRLNVTEETQ